MSPEERIEMLERNLEKLARMGETTMELLYQTQTRTIALKLLLVEKGLLSDAAIAARMQALDLDADAEMELAPEYESRRLGRRCSTT